LTTDQEVRSSNLFGRAIFLFEKVLILYVFITDEIARGLNPLRAETMRIKAGALALRQMDEYIAAKKTFAFETTASGNVYVRRLRAAKIAGFRIVLIYIFIESPEVAIARIAHRVRESGHNVDDTDVRRRYYRGLKNVFDLYLPLVDEASFVTNITNNLNGGGRLQIIAEVDKMEEIKVCIPDLWAEIQTQKDQKE
jgi:predicted ABC-type ATPase